jgi:hypothetical protein
LEGAELALMKKGGRPEIRPKSEGYSSSHSINFYGGVKPYKRRKRKKGQTGLSSKLSKGGLRKRRAKKIAGFRKALKLLPRKKRRVRSYRYLKSTKARPFLWRQPRLSRLRTPLAWSKKSAQLSKTTPNLGLRAGLLKLSPKATGPGKSYKPTSEVFSTHLPRFGQ